MDTYVRGFVRASLVWLGVGVLLGMVMAFWPGAALGWRPAHMHANLLGFVSMMIFGVAYHVLPRFSGRALHDRRLAMVHLWVANAGLALMTAGFGLRLSHWASGSAVLQVGAAASGIGAFLFIYNIWRTTAVPRPAAPMPSGPDVRGVPLPRVSP
jgi:heme/copper-type cytochrome/quinol oxidase subunit 1